ncbi:hypothetical protein RHMOL_Rhmol13G0220400 [Rhododendron molle]|uniref:Uncharacterized protein n=1 Tax=Rhododendron molle TaxID=49168 RepID=A0ACC0L958_RHOML|nr:hypothetical protein RHMOL_Rhmol13G0220400 [Rhododendron molle]
MAGARRPHRLPPSPGPTPSPSPPTAFARTPPTSAVLAFSILSHPFSLLTLISLLAARLLHPVFVYGRTLTSVGSLLLWGALV